MPLSKAATLQFLNLFNVVGVKWYLSDLNLYHLIISNLSYFICLFAVSIPFVKSLAYLFSVGLLLFY
jgi:hypothetical protein